MFEGVLRIHHAPGHRGGAGAVLGHELRREALGIRIQDVIDVTLPIDCDRLLLVPRDRLVAHLLEQDRQLLRLGMGEFDELETIRAGRVLGGDGGGRGFVRKGTHDISSLAGAFFAPG